VGWLVVDKKKVKRSIKQLQRVKTWQLIILLVLMVFVTATFLRLNNIGMVEHRTAVVDADITGGNQLIQDRLLDLQRYVTAHMNTDMGKGVYLEATYKRDVQTAYTAASNDSNPNGNIYKKAQEVCAPKFTRYSTAYLQCTIGELNKYPAASNLISSVNFPQPAAYLHSFISPLWSPDFAGWSALICIAILTMIATRLVSVSILKLLLRHHYKSI
jgi:hypothetical protein